MGFEYTPWTIINFLKKIFEFLIKTTVEQIYCSFK